MIKVLDLFAGTQSVRKALDEMGVEYEYKGIDIYSPEKENIILDLTQDDIVNKLKDKLGDWKPDFIWASPVCNKLSLATAMKYGNNAYFKLDKETETITPWTIGSTTEGAKNYQKIVGTEKAYQEALWTLKMFDNTKKIMNHFNVPFAIENPQHSLTKYIMKEYITNICSYCMYGFEQRKNTQIFSNKKIELLKCNHKGYKPHKVAVYGKPKSQGKRLPDYAERASVPPKLIKEIIKQLVKEVGNE